MRDTAKNAKAQTLELDPKATCKIEREPGKIAFAVVRDGSGKLIGQHRVASFAWESACRRLRGKGPEE